MMSEDPGKTARVGQHRCPVCDKVFANRHNVVRHAQSVHSIVLKNLKKATFKCDQCHRPAYGHRHRLLKHLTYVHGFAPRYEELRFRSRDEFLAWKDEEEYREKVHFVTPSSHKEIFGGRLKRYYNCHRSGMFVARGERKRKLKSQGSCKVGTHCMATMTAIETKETGIVSVVYQKEHYGHTIDLGHVRLTKLERQVVTDQLLQGTSTAEVLRNIRCSMKRQLSKIHLITRKDLENISRVNLGCTLKQINERVRAGLVPRPIKTEAPDDSVDAEFLDDVPRDDSLEDDCLVECEDMEMVLNSVASLSSAQSSAKQRLFDAIRELCDKVGSYCGDDDRLVQVEQEVRCFSQLLDSRPMEEVLAECDPSQEVVNSETFVREETRRQRHDHGYSKTAC
uniref:Putative zinc finger transcription factor protein 17 n=1 Tax=Ixodes ricinus TaxID=34613 RepID=V5H786_IXORI